MEIKVSRRSLDRFRRTARKRYPIEYLEILLGHVTDQTIEIVKSAPIPHTSTLTSEDMGGCEYEVKDLEIIKLKAQSEGLEYLGSVHSHCGYSINNPSESDNEDAIDTGEKIFGIYSFVKNQKSGRIENGRLCFYEPQRPIVLTNGSSHETKDPNLDKPVAVGVGRKGNSRKR